MRKYLFIKSTIEMRHELYTLWNNFEVYKFLKGYDWITKREHEICCCFTKDQREVFIETTRCDWILGEPE